ncbi:MAG: lysophospholipid acyltransferase family protein, partial [Victivallales bacterium]|nr:lysophospholipid acyltransferase family protein [Victivallales bacterium]
IGGISLIWGQVLARILGFKIKITGDPDNFKGGPVVSNHTGYVDTLVHAAIWPIRFAPKESILRWPVIGWFIGTGRPIWIDRSSPRKSQEVLREFRESMAHDVPLLVYPEGTSTSGRDGILKFKSTPFEAVAKGNETLLPTLIRYGDTPDGKPMAWYGNMTLLGHLWRILGYKEIRAEVVILEPFTAAGRNRKELANFTHDLMEREYNKLFQKK